MRDKIGIKRLDHVCWVVRNLEDALPLLTDLMGMREVERWQDEEKGYRGVSLEVPGGGTGHFELMAPLGKDSYLDRFIAQRGPGLHHVTFEVRNINEAAQAIRDYGVEPYKGVQRSPGWAETYIHPKDSGGVLFQFYTKDEIHK